MMFWTNISFQNLLSYSNSWLESLHDLIMVWLVLIICIVLIMGALVMSKNTPTMIEMDSMVLEVTWTILPIFVLISIATPSINLLCSQDTFFSAPFSTIKLMSSQWSWQSEQSEEEALDHLLDSDKIDELSSYEYPMIVSFNKLSRVMLTSSDVLHSFGVPSLGIKLDSAPGRLNAVLFEPLSLGLITGSCYELCGSGHSAMPIYLLSI